MTCFVSPASDEARHSSSGTKAKSDILGERGRVAAERGGQREDQSQRKTNKNSTLKPALSSSIVENTTPRAEPGAVT